jgi:uncharacterized protein (DUF1330 family)
LIFDAASYNENTMLYYTQLIFVKKGKEEEFNSFEDRVLPLLANHGGELVYRLRPDNESFIEGAAELPYEIHLVTFKSVEGFKSYGADPQRLAFIGLKNESVERVVLIEGKEL